MSRLESAPSFAPATLRAIVHNPAAGGGRGARLRADIEAIFAPEGETRLLATEAPGHAVDLVESLLRERAAREPGGLTEIIALGGDGTLNEILLGAWRAGAFRSGAEGQGAPGLRVAVLPLGTTNVVARCLGVPRGPAVAARALVGGGPAGGASGAEVRLDLGLCRSEAGERPFLLACGVGFDAEIALGVSPRAKRWFGRHAYAASAFLATGRSDRGIVAEWERPDGSRGSSAAASVIIGNCTLYAGALRLARSASLQDGLLELALLHSTRLLPLLSASIMARLTDMASAHGVAVESARSVRVRATSRSAVHVDAEPFGHSPIEVDVLPRALRFRVPRPNWSQTPIAAIGV